MNWIAKRLRRLHWSINLLLFLGVVVVAAWLTRGSPQAAGSGYWTFAGALFASGVALVVAAVFGRVTAVSAVRNLRTPDDADPVWRAELAVVWTPDDAWGRVRSIAAAIGEVDNVDDEARWLTWWTASWIRADRYWIQVVDNGAGTAVVTYCAAFVGWMKLPEYEVSDRAQQVHDRLATMLQSA